MSKNAAPFIKRPTTGRTGPNRGSETLFRPSRTRPDAEDLEDLHYEALDDDEDLDDDGEERDDDRHDEARLSMESARRVADKHDPYRTRPADMLRGYEHWSRSAGRRRRGQRGGGDLLELAGASTQALARLLTIWVDLLGPLLPPALGLGRGGGRRWEQRWERGARGARRLDELDREDPRDERRGHGARYSAPGELSVAVEVASRRPVRVSLELDRGLLAEPLRVRPLRVPGTKEPAIRGAAVEVDGTDGAVVRVAVPDDVPAGTYEGAVLSADGRVRLGRLRALVREAAGEHDATGKQDTPGKPAV